MKARLLVLVAVGFGGLSLASAADWPQWRGPHRDGRVAEFTAPPSWPKALTQKWKVAVGNGDASPSLAGGKLYVFTRQGEDEVLRCLDAATGNEVWQDKYAAQPATQPAGGPHAGPRASPTVADGKVVTFGARGTLSCLDAATGQVAWRKDDFKGYWPQFFTASSPIIVDGLCVAQLGGKENGRGKTEGAVVAYDLATGAEKWKRPGGSPGYASPVLMTVGGTKLIIAQTDSEITAVTVADGKLVWEAPFPTGQMAYNASTPIVDGQTLIYGGTRRGEIAVRLEKQGDAVTAKELWANKDNSVQFNSPVLVNGRIIGLTQGGQFFCIDAKTGKTEWTAPGPEAQGAAPAPPAGAPGKAGRGGMRGGSRGAQFGSVVSAGSVLLALTPKAQLVVLQPSDQGIKHLASYKVADSETYAGPVVAGNRVYVKDQESVILWTID
jgi:outer membrane protein assembly factor BamB